MSIIAQRSTKVKKANLKTARRTPLAILAPMLATARRLGLDGLTADLEALAERWERRYRSGTTV